MNSSASALAGWTPEQIEQGGQWVATWRRAGAALEQIRRAELRALDSRRAIALLCGSSTAARPLRPTSGFVEQQRWFLRAARAPLA